MLSEQDKIKKQQDVFGLTGGSFGEIVSLLLVVPCSVILFRVLYRSVYGKSFRYWPSFFFGIVFTVFPLLLAMSIYSDFVIPYCISCLLISYVLDRLICSKVGTSPEQSIEWNSQLNSMNGRIKPFLGNYRAAMMLATCVAILAVDFADFFPRRFAKCEEYGISLMDVGVGGFIFSSALVSSKSKSKVISLVKNTDDKSKSADRSVPMANSSQKSKEPLLTSNQPTAEPTWARKMFNTFKTVIPLLVLGIGRFSVIKAIGYQEHVTEYGMHWNFFMTLAGIALLVSALDIPIELASVSGMILLIVYQYGLTSLGVADYIIQAPRGTNFFSQNREGILSCIGFMAIYLIGQTLGAFLMFPRTVKKWWLVVMQLIVAGSLFWLAANLMQSQLGIDASRRMANMPYAFYTLSTNVFIIAAFIVADLVAVNTPNILLDSVATKRNSQLVIFTVANLLTGATNVFVGTINRSNLEAFIIMSGYMIIVSLVSIFWTNIIAVFQKRKQK